MKGIVGTVLMATRSADGVLFPRTRLRRWQVVVILVGLLAVGVPGQASATGAPFAGMAGSGDHGDSADQPEQLSALGVAAVFDLLALLPGGLAYGFAYNKHYNGLDGGHPGWATGAASLSELLVLGGTAKAATMGSPSAGTWVLIGLATCALTGANVWAVYYAWSQEPDYGSATVVPYVTADGAGVAGVWRF